jgi:tetratricopeptide (TPR) repeat protein
VKKGLIRVGAFTLAVAVLAGLAPGVMRSAAIAQGAATGVGVIRGSIKDEQGAAAVGVSVVLTPQGGAGQESTVVTDKDGKFIKTGLPAGTYIISYRNGDKEFFRISARVAANHDTDATLDMKDPKVADYIAARKKELENEEKFGKMKTHFEAGNTALTQAQALRSQLSKAPTDQRADLQAKLDPIAAQAVNEYQQAVAAAEPGDTKNRAAILVKMGEALDAAGRFDEAADTYKQGIALKPDSGSYNNMGNDLAKAGKYDEAKAAYEKSAELDPTQAALAYRNFGIVLYSAGKLQGSPAAELLQKSAQLDPKNAQTWYLLGAALAANMTFKQEGDKVVFTLLPGTIEAYQKCIEADPNGPYAESARQGIEELKAMGLGIDKKVTAPKVKH